MNFYIKDSDGVQQGPFDEETLKKFVEIEKINSETQIRNHMLPSWKPASDIDFLKDALAAQAEKEEEIIEENKSILQRSLELIGLGGSSEQSHIKTPVKSCFENKYVPDSAGFIQRVKAAITDFIIVGVVALILLSIGTAAVMLKAYDTTAFVEIPKSEPAAKDVKKNENAENTAKKTSDDILAEAKKRTEAADKPPVQPVDLFSAETSPSNADDSTKGFHIGSLWTNSASGIVYGCVSSSEGSAKWCPVPFMNQVFYILFTVFFVVTLLYYGISLGFFAQTFGMWFWGIFIVCYDKATPVFLFRAYIFALAGFLFGILLPVMTILPGQRSIHDILTGVWVIRIASKSE